jgi:predicted dinucleotide-binding enzyme
MKIGVIGSGDVGRTLADGFLSRGHEVMCGTRDASKLGDWARAGGERASVGTPQETADFGEVVVLAVKGVAAEGGVSAVGPGGLAGKTVIDTTNPISEGAPPEDGVLRYFTAMNASLMERLQEVAPDARFVKAFSCVGSALMVDPPLHRGRPTMFICGNHAGAKDQVRDRLEDFGWDAEDLGPATAARAIEPVAMLWCIPGFRENDWMRAYAVLRPPE